MAFNSPGEPFSVPDPLGDAWDEMVRENQALQAKNDPLAFDSVTPSADYSQMASVPALTAGDPIAEPSPDSDPSAGDTGVQDAAADPPDATGGSPSTQSIVALLHPETAPSAMQAAQDVSTVAAPASVTQAPDTPARLDSSRYGTGPILGLVSTGEGTTGADGYDTTYAGGRHWYPPGVKKPTQLTVDQWIALGPQLAAANGSSAMGKFQIMHDTLAGAHGQPGLKAQMGLKGDELMTPELQNEMAEQQLFKRGYFQYVAGKMSPEAFQTELSKEWRSLASGPDNYVYEGKPAGEYEKKIPARVKTEDIQNAIAQAKAAQRRIDAQLDAGQLPPP